MECRCYQGGDGRTKMKLLRYKLLDFEAFAVGILLIAGVCVLRHFGL
jgi:energy-coupling factor transport system permease protein